ncbi:hypothetical protein EV641_106149 [Rhodococcus sp. SMB37]|uniref:hypothetical protein n=1 Tax=Rhodococcus sp. SMB37 TaxID=2512213 RepID=UPI00105137AB|nr:hypothetical protein [Rhodococcus sp. SMB37]TCN53504.1 hypothetical protein EV641_106149 [Rhodococcus sp. SMB37]
MTASITALPAGVAAEVDGAAALVVGYLHAFPRHPQRGALVQPFGGAQTSVSETGVIGVPLYALVSVDWATEVTTIEPGGRTRTVFATGWPGTPQGTTWYLYPAEHHADLGIYVLDTEARYAASGRAAEVPARVRESVRSWGFGGDEGVPARVAVHNFAL